MNEEEPVITSKFYLPDFDNILCDDNYIGDEHIDEPIDEPIDKHIDEQVESVNEPIVKPKPLKKKKQIVTPDVSDKSETSDTYDTSNVPEEINIINKVVSKPIPISIPIKTKPSSTGWGQVKIKD
jgi:hypothetical protein